MTYIKKCLTAIVFIMLLRVVTIPEKAYIQKKGIVLEKVTVRQEADESAKKVTKLTAGDVVKVNNEITANSGKKWYQIYTEDGMGYVLASYVYVENAEKQTQPETKTEVVKVTVHVGTVSVQSAIRVREKATTQSAQVASLEPGDTFLVLEEEAGTDGYIWYQIEFDDNGTIVKGYVRSDLASVEEVVREEHVQVESNMPMTEGGNAVTLENANTPYSIVSQMDVSGTIKWYLVDNASGDTTEIEYLLSGSATPLREKVNVGIYKCLIIATLCVAIYFYKRWREAFRDVKGMPID